MKYISNLIKTNSRNVSWRFAFACLALAMLFSIVPVKQIEAQTVVPKKTVVLVHGSFADGSSWEKVIPLLQAKGLNVVAVQIPLNGLANDVAVAKRAIDASPGEVILVGHSWGGTVITEAGNNEKVKALVYVAAFAPSKNQSVGDILKDYPNPEWFGSVNVDSSGFWKLSPEAVGKFFAQDLTAGQTNLMAVTQGPILPSVFGDKITEAAWSSKPSWYIVGTKDLMIGAELEKMMAKKIGATTTVLESSHVPMLSKPKEVADVILAAAGMTKK
jgi:pimeloyl-ACP methyl ester carboxylesterase